MTEDSQGLVLIICFVTFTAYYKSENGYSLTGILPSKYMIYDCFLTRENAGQRKHVF